MDERVKHIIKDYPHWLEDIENLYKILGYLKQFCGNKNVEYWKSLVEKREWETFVKSLLTHHYDPTYTLSQKKNQLTDDVVNIDIVDLSDESLKALVNKLVTL
jgi:tRNA 2-selenouridine synthase